MAEIKNFTDFENITYCGKEAQEIFSKSLYNSDLANTGVTLMPNVKSKTKLYTGEISDVWQKYSCPFTPSGEASLAESYIEPSEIKVNLENCYDAFWPTFMVEQTKIGLQGGIPQTFFDWFFNDELLVKMSKEYQEIFWKGDTDYSEETKKYLAVTDGIEKKLKNSDAEQVAGTKFTVDNILAQVEGLVTKALDNAAEQDVDSDDYVIFMNHSDVKLLEVALGKESANILTTSVFSNYYREGDTIYVLGHKVVRTQQSRNTAIIGPVRNIVLGFDQWSDRVSYKLIDLRESTGDNAFRVLAIANIAVGVVLPELFVYLSAN